MHRRHRGRGGAPGGGRRLDPDPQVPGRGVAALRAAGHRGGGRGGRRRGGRAAGPLPEAPPHRAALGRPQAGRHPGRPHRRPRRVARWITGEAARADAHRLRAMSDAVLVGAGTVRADDPSSPCAARTTRSRAPATSLRVVLGHAPAGARVLPGPRDDGDLGAVLDELGPGASSRSWWRGEPGGPRLPRGGVVDRYVLYLAPALFGGDDAVPMFAGPGAPRVEELWRGRLVSVDQAGRRRPRGAGSRPGAAAREGAAVMAVQRRSREPSRPSAAGEIVVVVDDEDRENEGDLVMAAEAATPEKIAFFLAHTSGVICVPAHARAGRPARAAPDGDGQHRGPAHGLHRQRRLPPRDHHGHLGRGPGRHHPGPHRPPHPADAT